MTQQPPEASRIVEEAGVRILDELAVEGGRATRAHLFDKCQVILWGHVVNVAARRAGYTGHSDAEIARHGKEQLFVEAMNLLLGREQIVAWDDTGNVIALHPTHREDYIPGTNLWRSQRRIALDEMRRPLLQIRDRHDEQSFEATLQKAGAIYAQQLRRGQLAGRIREEAVAELLALADILFDPTQLAILLGIDEAELRGIAMRRLQPTSAEIAPKRKQSKRKSMVLPKSTEPEPADPEPGEKLAEPARDSTEPALGTREPESTDAPFDGSDLRRARVAHGWTQRELARQVGISHSAIGKWELGIHPVDPFVLRRFRELFATNPVPNGQA